MPGKPSNLIYGVEESPTLYELIVLGIQHVFIISVAFVFPVIIIQECGGEIRVDPANIEASQMLTKVIGPPSCGELMPNTLPEETAEAWLPANRDASIQCLREWLLNLVANNPQ